MQGGSYKMTDLINEIWSF